MDVESFPVKAYVVQCASVEAYWSRLRAVLRPRLNDRDFSVVLACHAIAYGTLSAEWLEDELKNERYDPDGV